MLESPPPARNPYTFQYASAGGGISRGSPINVESSSYDNYSSGELFILERFSGDELTSDDLGGLCWVVEVGGGFVRGGTATVMLLGIPWTRIPLELLQTVLLGQGPASNTVVDVLVTASGWATLGPLGAYVAHKYEKQVLLKLLGLLESNAKALLTMGGTNSGPQLTAGISGSVGYFWTGAKPYALDPGPGQAPTGQPRQQWKVAAVIRLPGDMLFGFDQDWLRPTAEQGLGLASNYIKQYLADGGSIRFLSVEGHADLVGSAGYNVGLSNRRALTVARWLIEKKVVDPAKIKTYGWGKSKPLTMNMDPKEQEKNRRVEILIFN